MKCVFLLFDSLNRHALSCYADNTIPTPNFARLAQRSTVFERHFVGSLPCMPARRDIQTGRLNFLHRGWGPLEPFDHSLAAILRDSGIATHLITDHYHYFEDGGAGFHGRYSSWDFIRGQEKDKWRPPIDPVPARWAARFDQRQHDFSPDINSKLPYYINRDHLEATGAYPLAQCFDAARGFLDAHHASDDWTCISNASTRMNRFSRRNVFWPTFPRRSAARFSIGRPMGTTTSIRRCSPPCAPTTTRW